MDESNRFGGAVIHDREVAHKGNYLSFPSPESRALYISTRNHAKSILQLAKHSFINRKCQKLRSSVWLSMQESRLGSKGNTGGQQATCTVHTHAAPW